MICSFVCVVLRLPVLLSFEPENSPCTWTNKVASPSKKWCDILSCGGLKMLVIRERQMLEMGARRRTAFFWELVREGRRRYPAFCAAETNERLVEIVLSMVEQAESSGLFMREHIVRFVFLVMDRGLNCEALAVLHDPKLVGPRKLDRLEALPRPAAE